MTYHTATYTPDDNKLRLYPASRLDDATYQRLRAGGFIWAPKQALFVAPAWTPAREDILLDLCADIDDEDKTLVARAEERAARFNGYSEKRNDDYKHARDAVARIADHIPLGQPILIGHHSERRARRDAERIDNGMRKAVKMWETADYWTQRAAGARLHAIYKERPDVRARRVKGIEADKRRQVKVMQEAQRHLRCWNCIETPEKFKRVSDGATLTTMDEAAKVAADFAPFSVLDPATQQYWRAAEVLRPDGERRQGCPAFTAQQLLERARKVFSQTIAHGERWIGHYDHRLAYERAMMAEAGGLAAEKHTIEIGGRVLVRGEWVTVLKINKANGKITSLGTNRRYVAKIGIEEVNDYQAPTAAHAAQVKAAIKRAGVYNYPGEGFCHITQAQWQAVSKDYKGTREVKNDPQHERHAARVMMGCFANPGDKDPNKRHAYPFVYITDGKRKDPPQRAADPAGRDTPLIPPPQRAVAPTREGAVFPAGHTTQIDAAAVQALRAQIKTGVQVVTVSQLFVTPPALASRMVELARLPLGARVLEPSAGTGALLQALPGVLLFPGSRQTACHVVAYEINRMLADNLTKTGLAQTVICADFLDATVDEEKFDVVLMNPPFANADDIQHIRHALTMLKPGGRLVAICANGPRQQAALGPLVTAHGGTWEDLPADTFKSSGTGVNTALITMTA